jgi:hypothetical protein
MMFYGLGSGACGLTSLAAFLRRQPAAKRVTREGSPMPIAWQGSVTIALAYADTIRAADELDGYSLVGDVATYHLPYAWAIAHRHSECRFVCLKRDRTPCVNHFVQVQKRCNPWHEHGVGRFTGFRHTSEDHTMPSLGVPDVRDAAGIYYDLYYTAATILARELPSRFRIFPTTSLDSVAGQNAILDFLEVPDEKRIAFDGGIDTSQNRGVELQAGE